MNAFEKLNYGNEFLLTVLEDGKKDLPEIDVPPTAIEIPESVTLSEYQYYIQKVGFYLVHTLTWCKQLDLAIEFLSNYDYSKKINSSRADHLIYNIENYLIRLNSVYDRVLQIVNATFHLCIDEEHVNHSVIITNHKVVHRPEIQKAIKKIQKYLKDYAQARHTLIHKHSYQDAKLRRIELFYLHTPDPKKDDRWNKNLKSFRANYLKEYLAEKKNEFANINDDLSALMVELFDLLLEEYKYQKVNLK